MDDYIPAYVPDMNLNGEADVHDFVLFHAMMDEEAEGEDAVLEMLEFCASHPDATQAELLNAADKIASRMKRMRQEDL